MELSDQLQSACIFPFKDCVAQDRSWVTLTRTRNIDYPQLTTPGCTVHGVHTFTLAASRPPLHPWQPNGCELVLHAVFITDSDSLMILSFISCYVWNCFISYRQAKFFSASPTLVLSSSNHDENMTFCHCILNLSESLWHGICFSPSHEEYLVSQYH